MRLRGALDLLEAETLAVQQTALLQDRGELYAELGEILDFLRRLLAAEVVGRACPELHLGGFSGDELRTISHNTARHLGVGFVLPAANHGVLVVQLNLLRAKSRELELTAADALSRADHVNGEFRSRAGQQLNRLSSALHVLGCREMARVG